jgi:hypothetical protein
MACSMAFRMSGTRSFVALRCQGWTACSTASVCTVHSALQLQSRRRAATVALVTNSNKCFGDEPLHCCSSSATVWDRYLHAIERQQRPTVSEKLLCHGMRRRLQRREPVHLCRLHGTQLHRNPSLQQSTRQLQQAAPMLQRTAHTRKKYSEPKCCDKQTALLLCLHRYNTQCSVNLTTRNIGLPALVDRGAGWRFVIVITQRAEAQAACSPHSVCTRCNR